MSFWSGATIVLGTSVIAVLLLPACYSLELPGHCNDQSQPIVLDYDDVKDYSILQGVCKDGATCTCLPGDPHSITNAYIYDRNGRQYNMSISHDRHHFSVVLSELSKPLPGIHTYRFGYDYECPYISLGLKCHKGKSKEMKLTVKIVDYKLNVYDTSSSPSVTADNNTEGNFIIYNGSNITLLCSSSLTGVNDSALDIPVEFAFNSSGTNYTKSGKCMNTESINTEANWIISRQHFPPYDCTLTIVDFSSKDIGEYWCAGLLPHDGAQYEKDWSEVISVDLLNTDFPTKPSKRKLKTLPLISITALLLCVIAVLFVVYKYYSKRKRRQDHQPVMTPASSTTSLINHRSLRQSYGTASGDSSLTTDSIPNIAIIENEREIESNISQHTIEVSLEEPSAAGRGVLSQNAPQSQEGAHVSTISAGTEGRQYYEQYTDIQHPDGKRTPESSEAPLDENYKCHHCGRIYHSDQRLFYARHMAELQRRCPNCNGGSGMNNANKNNLDTKATRLSDSLSPAPSEGDPSSALQCLGIRLANSYQILYHAGSRGSTMSEIREGRGYYNDYTEMQVPEGGSTPEETEVPLDDHFKCPLCGKTYHENQRLYFKRHIDELQYRCPKYNFLIAERGSSGSSSPEQSVCEPPYKASREQQ